MNLLHVYFGSGKGKTTAALGLALRAAGHGQKVVIVQFLKGRPSGELGPLALIDKITVLRGQASPRFSKQMTPGEREQTRLIHDENLKRAIGLIDNGECDLLVLDNVAFDVAVFALFEHVLHVDVAAVVQIRRGPPSFDKRRRVEAARIM